MAIERDCGERLSGYDSEKKSKEQFMLSLDEKVTNFLSAYFKNTDVDISEKNFALTAKLIKFDVLEGIDDLLKREK